MGASRKISKGLILFCVFTFLNLYVRAASSIPTKPDIRLSFQELFRVKRQACQDGTYEHEGRSCCQCAAGQRVKEHCTKTPNDGKCELCEEGSYNSEANYKEFCDLCTSCDHENANLEENESCSPLKDRTCRCKKDYYCPSGPGVCKICHACETCESTSVKTPCSTTNNTVCNEENKGLGGGGVAVIVIVVLVAVAFALVGIVFRKRILEFFKSTPDPVSPSHPVVEPLIAVDMDPHMDDIADILGWKDMMAIARSSRMSNAIDSVKLSHPNDSDMWAEELLRKWVEKTGKDASVELISTLQKKHKKNKADKIREKLYGSNPPTQEGSSV